MDKQTAQLIMMFLRRVDMKGAETENMVKCINAVSDIIDNRAVCITQAELEKLMEGKQEGKEPKPKDESRKPKEVKA